MFKPTLSLIAISAFSLSVIAADNATASNIGYTGTLSSLDGGLGGVVTVIDANTLSITSYTLKDASAPALYWWGSTTSKLSSGFRISNEQVTKAATSDMLEIELDAGKTSADFSVVGLWCERLSANFGQAELKAADGMTGTGTTTEAPAASKTGAGARLDSGGVAAAVVVGAGMFVLLLM
jgi:hypothetical protein